MSRYSIEGSTLTAIGDAIREKTNKPIRIESFPVEQNTFVIPVHPEDIDVTQLSDKNSYGQVTSYWHYIQDIVVPGAVKFQVNYTFDTNLTDSYAVYAFKEDGKVDKSTSVYCNSNGTTSGKIIKTSHNKVRIEVDINKDYWEMKNYSYCDFEIIGLDVDGNPVTEYEAEVINTLTPLEMAAEIDNIQVLPESAFNITGNCSYRFANNGWNWFIDDYGNQIQTKDITNTDYMFQKSTLEHIPFEINLKSTGSSHSMFEGCEVLKEIPVVNNLAPGTKIFKDCKKMTSLNNIKLRKTPNNFYCDSMFGNCYSLRSIEGFFDNVSDTVAGASIYGMYNVFEYCRTLDELVNLPYIYSTYSSSSYSFGNFVYYNCRLKELTFRDGIVLTSGPKGGASLNVSTYVGYSNVDLVQYGMSADKKVTDDASYQALKDDPDWWAMDVNYSRYNHDSAVNTINSLPDLSSLSYTNTIRFKGAAGELTDGGAINTLTEEEIAVAAAKGWTVALT